MEIKIGLNYCPGCGSQITVCRSDFMIKPGAIVCCAWCATLCEFTDDMSLIELREEYYSVLDYQSRIYIAELRHWIVNHLHEPVSNPPQHGA